jgi:hypothetical protein
LSAADRPAYGWCTYYAAKETHALGDKAMTVVEFGVAGGTGRSIYASTREIFRKNSALKFW